MASSLACKILIISLLSMRIPDALAKKLLCYIQTTQERSPDYRLLPQNIDTDLCTHVIFTVDRFEFDDSSSFTLPKTWRQQLTSQERRDELLELQRRNANITWMMSIGGWEQGSAEFSKIVSKKITRSWVIYVIWNHLKEMELDGVEINWQWPSFRIGAGPEDRTNYAIFIQELKAYMVERSQEANRPSLVLSVVLPPLMETALLGFDLEIISREADLLTLMTMDYHSSTDPVINHHAPLYTSPNISQHPYTVASTVEFYLDMGVDPEKMILGIPLYGRSFTLMSAYNNKPGSSSDDEGREGFATKNPGTLAYFEICKYIKESGWSVERPSVTAMGPYAYKDKDWVAYDDPKIIEKKVEFVCTKGLGGVFLWTLDMDDFKATCSYKFPLAEAAKQTLTMEVLLRLLKSLRHVQDSADSYEDEADSCNTIEMHLHGADINSRKDSKTRSMIAAEKGDLKFLRCLVKLGADLNMTADRGRTALHYAAINSHVHVLKYLSRQSIDFNATDYENRTALHLAVRSSKRNIIYAVQSLLKRGVRINRPDKYGLTALHIASENAKLPLMELLLAKGANIHAKDRNSNTALHKAVKMNNLPVVQLLIRRGANINAGNILGTTALHAAALFGNVAIAEVLLDEGADVNATTSDGLTPLHVAANKGHLSVVRLLLMKDVHVNAANDKGHTVLHYVAKHGDAAIVKLLLSRGAFINATDTDGRTPLHWAVEWGKLPVIKQLLNNGAHVNSQDNEGRTPLDILDIRGFYAKDIRQILTKRGGKTRSTPKS